MIYWKEGIVKSLGKKLENYVHILALNLNFK